ncbi:MAG: hypothetical protein A2231_03130 [Candidatus Firestonebacteria bacterium RIFOXYA2_FULL_40_8]|nr:MAG: hypothetical protein A2231_03130 [Candidatus Firestonebacteria bacterium RIFOXYA2_FULL_40_8]
MKTYSVEEKIKAGAWVQSHRGYEGEKIYKIHYIKFGTEYSTGQYFTKKSATAELKKYSKP